MSQEQILVGLDDFKPPPRGPKSIRSFFSRKYSAEDNARDQAALDAYLQTYIPVKALQVANAIEIDQANPIKVIEKAKTVYEPPPIAANLHPMYAASFNDEKVDYTDTYDIIMYSKVIYLCNLFLKLRSLEYAYSDKIKKICSSSNNYVFYSNGLTVAAKEGRWAVKKFMLSGLKNRNYNMIQDAKNNLFNSPPSINSYGYTHNMDVTELFNACLLYQLNRRFNISKIVDDYYQKNFAAKNAAYRKSDRCRSINSEIEKIQSLHDSRRTAYDQKEAEYRQLVEVKVPAMRAQLDGEAAQLQSAEQEIEQTLAPLRQQYTDQGCEGTVRGGRRRHRKSMQLKSKVHRSKRRTTKRRRSLFV